MELFKVQINIKVYVNFFKNTFYMYGVIKLIKKF